MDERDVERILSHDFAAEATEFHDRLLDRCLAVLRQNGFRVLEDEDLEMLAAAGNPHEMLRFGFPAVDPMQ